jgi:hypothetical protein
MQELIDLIRAAIATDATAEQKASGAQACRTIMTALGAEPGKPIALQGAPSPHPLNGLTFDHAIDLVIAKLSTVADARDAAPKLPAAPPRGPQIPIVKPQPLAPNTPRLPRRKP